MNALPKLLVAAAAVVVVAVAGANLLSQGTSPGGVGSASPSLTPATTASPSSEPTAPASPTVPPFPPRGELAPGPGVASHLGVPFTFVVPAPEWYSDGFYFVKAAAFLAFWNEIANVYADPCQAVVLDPPVGPSPEDLADALSSLPGTDALEPVPDTIGGLDAIRVEFTIRDDILCQPQGFQLWQEQGATSANGRFAQALGQRERLWVLELGGVRTIISTTVQPDTPPAVVAELQSLVDSLEFD